MSEKTARIILKEGQPKKIEVTIGTKTVKAVQGQAVEIPVDQLHSLLRTGRFEVVKEAVSDLPQEIPGRAVLVANNITFDQVKEMTKAELLEIKNIGQAIADQILLFITPEGGNQ